MFEQLFCRETLNIFDGDGMGTNENAVFESCFFFFNDENEKAFKSRKEALNANKLFGRNETSYQNKNKNIFWETFLLFV